MTKKVQTPEVDIMGESKGKIESFFDKFGSKLMWGIVAVTVIAVGIFVWYNYSEGKNAEMEQAAQEQFFTVLSTSNTASIAAESFSIDYAATADSYLAVANEYPETKAGNISYYMAASNYLKANDLANAKAAINKFKNIEGDFGMHINAMALTIKGDIAVEEFDNQSAASYFEKALAASKNADIYVMNAKKLGLVYEAMGNEAKAQQVYKTAVEKYHAVANAFAKYIKE